MTSRGSLRQMVDLAVTLFAQQRFSQLAITHNERGKYYSLVTPEQLADIVQKHPTSHPRIVLNITFTELRGICTNDQLSLFKPNT